MMIVIEGREYPFPALDSLTFREAALVKKITGLKVGQLFEAFEQGDMDVLVGFAAVAKKRVDGGLDESALYDLPISAIEIVVPEDEEEPEEEAGPLDQADAPAPEAEAAEEAPAKKRKK